MAVKLADLRLYGSASMPDDDSATAIGGAIAHSKRVMFTDVAGQVQAISSSASDTAVNVTVTYMNALVSPPVQATETQSLNGLTAVPFALTAERLLKAIKAIGTVGDVAIEATAAERTNTAQGGDADRIQLDAGASAVDQFYVGMIVRLTSGTGSGQIRMVVGYSGTTKQAVVNVAWATPPDATSGFRISKGFFFDRTPNEVLEVRRVFFQAAADTPTGDPRNYYEKVFFENSSATDDLFSAEVAEVTDPRGNVAIGLATTLNDTGTNGGGNNRRVAPAGVTFVASGSTPVPGGTLPATQRAGTWLRLTLLQGTGSANVVYVPKLRGITT